MNISYQGSSIEFAYRIYVFHFMIQYICVNLGDTNRGPIYKADKNEFLSLDVSLLAN